MRTPACIVSVLLLLAGCPAPVSAASAGEFVQIGKLKVRADSPLAKGEYPRLLITRAQLPAIRARLKHPEIQKYLQQARDLVKIGKASPLLLGVLYQMTGEKQYAEMAKRELEKTFGHPTRWGIWPELTFAFDLVAETLSEAERRDYARKILVAMKTAPEMPSPHVLLPLLAWGNGIDGELAPYLEQNYESEVTRKLAYCNGWTRGRGGSPRSHGYNGQAFVSRYFSNMIGWSHATGEDVLSKSDFARQQPVWYIYHYLPWEKRRRLLRIGVTSAPQHVYSVTPAYSEGTSLMMLAITQTRNGLGQWWEREFIGNWPMAHWRKGQEHIYGLSGRLLWLDPSIPSIPPAQFPETRLFPENGHVCMRSGWSEDATVVLFRCGRAGKTDKRNNADNLHFIIWKGGHLAPDTGCAHHVNEGQCKMVIGANLHCYGKQTIAQNAITVGREPIEQPRWAWGNRLLGNIRRGGQTILQEKDWLLQWGVKPTPEHPFREGDIVAYETSPEFDYVCGDATHSYPPSRVKSITRQFVYLKPDTFVIFDRVTPTEAKLEVIWNFHALKEPAWNGQRAPDPAWPPERQFVISTDRKQVPNPHPGGHFLHTGGDAFRISEGDGELDLQMLLPAADDRVVRTIGGPWHDFEVNGVNYGPTEATYRAKRRHVNVAVGGWRIEVSPKGPAEEVRFLHVMKVGKKGELHPPQTTLMKQGERLGAKIAGGDAAAEFLFNTTGKPGGHVRIIRNGRVLLNEELVTQVEDHYGRWKADPRYAEWMTNEYMRAVIFPYGEKPE